MTTNFTGHCGEEKVLLNVYNFLPRGQGERQVNRWKVTITHKHLQSRKYHASGSFSDQYLSVD